MPVVNRNLQSIITSVNVTGGNFQALILNPTFVAGNWNGDTPTNLEAIADGDPDTGTTWGRTYWAGNRGWIQADLGDFYHRLYLEIKAGIKMTSDWAGGNSDWFLEVAEESEAFVPIWEIKQFRPTAEERILHLGVLTSCRYLRLGCDDNGNGQGQLKWYSLKTWQLII